MFNEDKISLSLDRDHVSTIINLLVEKLHNSQLLEEFAADKYIELEQKVKALENEKDDLTDRIADIACEFVSLQTRHNALLDRLPAGEED